MPLGKKELFITTALLGLLILGLPKIMFAACTGSSPTWTCTTGTSWADIETFIEGGSYSDGDTINIEAGTYTGSSTITIPSDKSVTITGNSVAGS